MTDPKFNSKVLELIEKKPDFTVDDPTQENPSRTVTIEVDWVNLFMELHEYQRLARGSSFYPVFGFTIGEFQRAVSYSWNYKKSEPLTNTQKAPQVILDKLCEAGLAFPYAFQINPVFAKMPVPDPVEGYVLRELTETDDILQDLPEPVSLWNHTKFNQVFDFIKVDYFANFPGYAVERIKDILKAMTLYTYHWQANYETADADDRKFPVMSENVLYLETLSNMWISPVTAPLWLNDVWHECLEELRAKQAFRTEAFSLHRGYEIGAKFFSEFTAYSRRCWQHGIGYGWVGIQRNLYQQFSEEK